MHSPQRLRDDERGVSEVVGTVLILGFVIVVGIGAVYFGYSVIEDTSTSRVQSQFSLDGLNETHIGIVYTNGEPFTSQDTHKLYVEVINETDEQTVVLYDESSSYYGNATIEEGDTVLNPYDGNESHISPGDTLRFVWVPEVNQNSQKIIDELTILPDRYIFISKHGGGGLLLGGNFTINNATEVPP